MKLVYKGIYKNEEQLPVGTLPDNAVKFKEPNKMAQIFVLTLLISIVTLIILFKISEIVLDYPPINSFNILGIYLFFPSIIPHEFLHALCWGKNDEVGFYIAPKQFMAFVHSTCPISKSRFIWMSACPTIFFGVLPFLVCIFIPDKNAIKDILWTFSLVSFTGGSGDYVNIFNALTQMPSGSVQQMSGLNSYWFLP
ncbi:MAG: DUF3267 domain-containing protein [Oscillospiraceae bacterium]|nr:DUF3267 domain-containing protein [Oscillospiraceae bacterium]